MSLTVSIIRPLQKKWDTSPPNAKLLFKAFAALILSTALVGGGFGLDTAYGWTNLPTLGGSGVIYATISAALTALFFTAMTYSTTSKVAKTQSSKNCRKYERVKTSEFGLKEKYFPDLTEEELQALHLELKDNDCISYTLKNRPETLWIACKTKGPPIKGHTLYKEAKILETQFDNYEWNFNLERLSENLGKKYDRRFAGMYILSKGFDQLIPFNNK